MYRYGLSFYYVKKFDKSILYYDRALEIDGKTADTWDAKGVVISEIQYGYMILIELWRVTKWLLNLIHTTFKRGVTRLRLFMTYPNLEKL